MELDPSTQSHLLYRASQLGDRASHAVQTASQAFERANKALEAIGNPPLVKIASLKEDYVARGAAAARERACQGQQNLPDYTNFLRQKMQEDGVRPVEVAPGDMMALRRVGETNGLADWARRASPATVAAIRGTGASRMRCQP